MVSTISSSVSTRTTPSVSATASKQASAPASDPVWASAALRLSSEPPILTATIGLPASRAYSQALLNSSACRIASMKQPITLMSGSSTR